MALKLSNNAVSTLAASITSGATTLSIQGGDAGKFPVLNTGDWCPATIIDSANNMEIVRVTARVGATLTIARAQEGTTAKAFAAGSRIDVRMTAAVVAELISLSDALSTELDNTNTEVGLKAPLSSPAFTDNPTTPTPPAGDADTTIPNTGWVAGEISTAITYVGEMLSQQAGNYTALKTDNAASIRFTTAATLALTAAETLGANWWCEVWATNGNVTIDPNGTQTVDGALTTVIQTGQMAKLFCTGTAFITQIIGDPLTGPHNQGFGSGLGLSTNVTDAANDINIAVGCAAADAAPFPLMQLASALTKRIDAAWAVGNNAGGLDTGAVAANGIYYIYEIQRTDTLVTDAIYSLSATTPTMPANYTRKRLIGWTSRVGSVNGPPVYLLPRPTLQSGLPVQPSGPSLTYTGIPAGVARFTIHLRNVVFSAGAQPFIKVGPSAGVVSTGYSGSLGTIAGAAGFSSGSFSNAINCLFSPGIANSMQGSITFTRVPGTFDWVFSGQATMPGDYVYSHTIQGGIALAAELDRFQLSTLAGTATMSGTSIWADWGGAA